MTRRIGDFKYMDLTQWAKDRADGIQYETPFGKVTCPPKWNKNDTYGGAITLGEYPRPGSMIYDKLQLIYSKRTYEYSFFCGGAHSWFQKLPIAAEMIVCGKCKLVRLIKDL